MKPAFYAARARTAHAAADAATDPRDKAAFRAAAQTWERLAKPAVNTWSLLPERLALEALKRDAPDVSAKPAPVAPVPQKAPTATVKPVTQRTSRVGQFSAVEEYLSSGIEF